MTKITCPISGNQFEHSADDQRLLEKLTPVINGQRYPLPQPILSPDERKRRRLSFRNERNLYRRKCDKSGTSIISSLSPDKPYPVYSQKVWWGDDWSPFDYGRNFDFSRPFFDQFAELLAVVPRACLKSDPDSIDNNCAYTNFAGSNRNCYLIFDSDFNEDSSYSNVLKHSRNCFDCSYVNRSELCYECTDCSNCYSLYYSQDCTNCSDSYYLNGCIGCKNCLFSTNLVQKEFHINNKPYSKADYFETLKTIDFTDREIVTQLAKKFEAFKVKQPRRFARQIKTENCIGDYIWNAKNCFHCYNISECEDLRYCDALYSAKDCMDVSSFGEAIEKVYESGTIGINAYNIYFCFGVVLNSSDMFYTVDSGQSQNCFGCFSIRRGKYCVLNKEYSKEEYFKLVPKIIAHMQRTGEWGEFFPMSLSAFGYNESVASERFPLNKAQALELGAEWSDYEPEKPDVPVILSSAVPSQIAEAADTILNQAIKCPTSGKPFRIQRAELDFYRKQGIPLPILHPDERHKARVNRRTPEKLWLRACAKTGEQLWTSYAPDRPEIIYSESAYHSILG